MPKHFAEEPRGRHFSASGNEPESGAEHTESQAPQPQQAAEPNERTAPKSAPEPSASEPPAANLGETRALAPDALPTPAETDERTALLDSVPSMEEDGELQETFPEVVPLGSPVTDGTTASLDRNKAARVSTEAPKPDASPEETPAALGRHEVAAVQADGDLYMRSEPSPYLSSRQARQDPQKTRHRHTVLIAVMLVLVALAVVGGGAYYIYRALHTDAPTSSVQFETDRITRGNFYDTIDAAVTLEPVSTADVIPEMTGTIKSLNVEDGSTVSKGDVLFTLDNPAVTAATTTAKDQLDEAQSDLDDKNDQLEDAQDKLDEVRSSLSDSASKIYSLLGSTPGAATFNVDTNDDGTPDALDVDGDGVADGYDTNGDGVVDMVDTNGDGTPDVFDSNGDGKVDATTDLPSSLTAEQKTELATSESSYQTAQSQLASAENAVSAATTTVKAAEDTVSNLQDAYDRAVSQEKKLTVTAPLSGVVHNLSSSLVEGGSISTTSKLCEVDDVSQLVFTIQASEAKARKAKVGQTVNLTFPDIADLTATGTVTSVATTRTEGTNTYAVDVTVSEPDSQLDIGTSANASVVLQEIDDVLMVPSKAITTSGRDSYLDVLLDPVRGIDTEVQVNVVADNGEQAVVEADNIQEGNAVVLSKTAN